MPIIIREVIIMKKTSIILSAVLAGATIVPSLANAKNVYPVFPQKPDGKEFDELTEEQQSAYLEAVGTYRSALCTAYRNGEYDWDFNLDGETTPLDAMYVGQYYAELSSGKKLDTFYYQGNDNITAYSFDDNMRAKISENGDVTSNGCIDVFDANQMLIALYSDKVEGDVNNDGMVDARDASAVLGFYADNSVSIQSDYVTEKNMEYLGDINNDEKTDAKDASEVLVIYASNSTQPPNESKVVWTETEPGEQVEISSVYKIFDRDNYLNQTSLIFDGTVTDIKEYAVSGQYENGEKWGPSNRTIIEVTVNDVYYGETDKKTIKFFYNTSLSRHSKGSFTIETGREYVFMAKELDDNAIQNLDAAKYADLTITAGLRDGIMPVSDGIVSVYHEYFDDNETAKAEALAKDEVMDKLTDDAKAANWFMYFNKADFVELFSELFSS